MEEELQEWRERVGERDDEFWRNFYSEAAVSETQLCQERERFHRGTILPLLKIRGSLKNGVRSEGVRGEGVRSVKSEAEKVAEQLEEEFNQIWAEVADICIEREKEVEMR